MANIEFYREHFGIESVSGAFDKFVATLANYFDAKYYVDWPKVFLKAARFENSLKLLGDLCGKDDIERRATELFFSHPEVIRALPILMASRKALSIANSAGISPMLTYTFIPKASIDSERMQEAEQYAAFLTHSGLSDILARIQNPADFAIGVEVGLDSNGRKNRGGTCGIQAITPVVDAIAVQLPNLVVLSEATFEDLEAAGFPLPVQFDGVVWDLAFWLKDRSRLVVAEVNHYGSSGSKPPAIAREYVARNVALAGAGIGFIWVTDGLGWLEMRNPLKAAFQDIDFVVNIQLAREGQLGAALTALLN